MLLKVPWFHMMSKETPTLAILNSINDHEGHGRPHPKHTKRVQEDVRIVVLQYL